MQFANKWGIFSLSKYFILLHNFIVNTMPVMYFGRDISFWWNKEKYVKNSGSYFSMPLWSLPWRRLHFDHPTTTTLFRNLPNPQFLDAQVHDVTRNRIAYRGKLLPAITSLRSVVRRTEYQLLIDRKGWVACWNFSWVLGCLWRGCL